MFCSIGFGSALQASPMMTFAAALPAGDSATSRVKLKISKHNAHGSSWTGSGAEEEEDITEAT